MAEKNIQSEIVGILVVRITFEPYYLMLATRIEKNLKENKWQIITRGAMAQLQNSTHYVYDPRDTHTHTPYKTDDNIERDRLSMTE